MNHLTRGGGGGGGRELDQSFASAVRGKYPGFASYGQKGQGNEKIAGYRGKQQWFYQRVVPAGWGF